MVSLQIDARRLLWAIVLFAIATGTISSLTAQGPASFAKPTEFRHKSWNRESGLPDNEVRALLQSRDGYIWIATRGGLCRFDGLTFKVFSHLTEPAFLSDYCTVLAQDNQDAIWIGTGDGLIQLKNGTFSRINRVEDQPFTAVGRLLWSPRSGLWMTTGSYISQWNGENFLRWPLNHPFPSTLSELEDGRILLGTNDGFFELNPEDRSIEQKGQRTNLPHAVAAICEVIQLAHETFLVLAQKPEDRGGQVYRVKNGVWSLLPAEPIEMTSQYFFATEGRKGEIWLPSSSGLQRFSDGQFTAWPLPAGQIARCVLTDREGNIWIGTQNSGLHCYSPQPFRSLTSDDGLPNSNVWALAETSDGTVWIGTDGGLVEYKNGIVSSYSETNGLPRDSVRALAGGQHGDLWIGTGKGLAILNEGRFSTNLTFSGEHIRYDLDNVSRNKIRAIAAHSETGVWVGSSYGLYSVSSNSYRAVREGQGELGYDIRALRANENGSVWIGTLKYGLTLYSNQQFIQFSSSNTYSADPIWAIHKDSAGALWLAGERGLNQFQNGRLVSITKSNGLPAEIINHIVEDDFGYLWLSLENGVCRVSKNELSAVASGSRTKVSYTFFDDADGMPSRETNGQKSQPAAIRRKNGELWFATAKGVAIVDPKNLELAEPRIVIETVRANDQLVYEDGRILLGSGDVPMLPPGGGRIVELHFSATTFVAADKCRFRFRLDGYDREWHEAGTRRVAFYTNLSPGKYRFRVMGCNHRNVWSESEASLAFVLTPFYYQTWAFRISVTLGLLGLIFGLHHYRVRHQRTIQQLHARIALAEEKTRIAQDLHDGIGSALTRLRLLAALAQRENTNQQSSNDAVRKISDLTGELDDNLREIIWISRTESQTLEGLLTRAAEQAEAFAKAGALKCHIEIPERIPDVRLPAKAAHNLYFTVKEAFNNSVKHAKAQNLRFEAIIEPDQLRLRISDNGVGIPASDKRKNHSGLGLVGMRARIEEIGGTFRLDSEAAHDTTNRPGLRVEIGVPLKNGSDKVLGI